ncbi:Inorganic phosphate transporter PHO86 [Lachancea thermotolerans]
MAKKTQPQMVEQMDASLHEPINKDAPLTIYGSKLKPELATAALNLSIDFLKQQQSLANQHVMWHRKTLGTAFLCAFVYLAPRATFPKGSKSVMGTVVQFVLMNKVQLVYFAVVTILAASFIFTFLARFTEDLFKRKISQVVDTNGVAVFGVDLTELVKGNIKDKSKLDNTQVIVYRETPIALASVVENSLMSSNDALVMGVSTIGSRRVYLQSGIIEDLLDWALIRTKNIQKTGKFEAGNSMKLLVEVYSFDKVMKKTLKSKGFSLIKAVKLEESRLLGGLFGVKKELWGVQFHFDSKKQK